MTILVDPRAHQELKLMVTLWPSFPHFARFAGDTRLAGLRLNSAMMSTSELETELAIIEKTPSRSPLYYDIKGRQPRVTVVDEYDDHLELELNHPIEVKTPTPLLFKAGADHALLQELKDGGKRLVLGPYEPKFKIKPGESLHIRHPSYRMLGPVFTDTEKIKIERVRRAGFTRWFLSYVEEEKDVGEFLELVGKDAELMLKIESKAGLEYALTEFRKRPNLTLVAARGDLYVEIGMPHEMPRATKAILAADPEALVGSRILLSAINNAVPECVDFSEIAWLYDIGYRTMMLCDELCLKEQLLARAVNAFDLFRRDYVENNNNSPQRVPK